MNVLNAPSMRPVASRPPLNVAPARAIAADTRSAGAQSPSTVFPSFDGPAAYKGYVINLVSQAKAAQSDLALAQAKGDAGAVRDAVDQLGVIQLQLIVARKEGLRKAGLWGGFDAGTFWESQREALPAKLLLTADQAIAQSPSISDPSVYKNYAVKLVSDAQGAQRLVDEAKAALAKGTGSQASLNAAMTYRDATLGELVLLKHDGDAKALAWRVLKSFDAKSFWNQQAQRLPSGFDLNTQFLSENIRVNERTLAAASVVKAWPGQENALRDVAKRNGADNVLFSIGRQLYMASASDLDVANLKPGTAVNYRGQVGMVVEAVSSPNTVRKMLKAATAWVPATLPSPRYMVTTLAIAGAGMAWMVWPLGAQIALTHGALAVLAPLALVGVNVVVGAALCLKAMKAVLQVNLYAGEAFGDPQVVAPKLK